MTLVAERVCGHCDGSMDGRRRDAVYCSRSCKTAASDRRRLEDGRAQRRDRARYAAEGDHRRAYASEHAREIREKVIAHYGGVCAGCGSTERLELDHVNANGERHRDIVGHGDAFFRYLLRKRFPPECASGGEYELQVLCREHHLAKTLRERRERG